MVIFYSYVSLPEGISHNLTEQDGGARKNCPHWSHDRTMEHQWPESFTGLMQIVSSRRWQSHRVTEFSKPTGVSSPKQPLSNFREYLALSSMTAPDDFIFCVFKNVKGFGPEANTPYQSPGHQVIPSPSILSLTTWNDPCWHRSVPTSRQQSHGDRQQVPGNFKAYQTTWSCHENPKASGNHDISWPWSWMLLLLFIVVWQLYDLQCCHLEKSDESRDVAGDIEMINRSTAHVRSSGRRCLEKQRHRKVCFRRNDAFETFVFFVAWDNVAM